jgi:hypothetical protein
MLAHFEADYDEWKPMFDSDPAGRRQSAKGHIISRGVADPNQIFVRTEFASVEDAKAFRERLLAAGVMERFTVKVPPTVVEIAEEKTY